MTIEQKMNAIEENYINGNIKDAKELFKKLPVAQRKQMSINVMHATAEDTCKFKHFRFAEFLIRNI